MDIFAFQNKKHYNRETQYNIQSIIHTNTSTRSKED